MLICPHIIYGCFQITVTELSCGDKDLYGSQTKTIYYLTLYRKSLLMVQTSETEKACFSHHTGLDRWSPGTGPWRRGDTFPLSFRSPG